MLHSIPPLIYYNKHNKLEGVLLWKKTLVLNIYWYFKVCLE